MTQWQPISTAPKDGIEIIVWGTRYGTSGYTNDEQGWTAVKWNMFDSAWRETKPQGRYSTGFIPTHWMPLPPPPE